MSAAITPATKDFTLANGLAIYKGSEWEITISIAEMESLVKTPFLCTYWALCLGCSSELTAIAHHMTIP